eukprot:5858199-Lingulodinium_polyedra.AAC.1
MQVLPWGRGVLRRVALDEETTLANDILEQAIAGRVLAKTLANKMSYEAMFGSFENLHESLDAQDDTWLVDNLLLAELAGPGGLCMMDSMLLDCLPKLGGPLWSLQQAIEKAGTVGQTTLCRLMGETGARRVATLQE